MDRRLLAWAYASRRAGAKLPRSGCSPTLGGCPIPARRRRGCRAASPASCCATTASRAGRRSGATWRGSAARGALPWWWPAMPRLAAALGAGVHLRAGRWPGVLRRRRSPVTSSAHGPADLLRAHRAGAGLAFLSPAFPTLSHPDVAALGSGPLGAPGRCCATAGGGTWRRRWRRRPAPAAPHLPRSGGDRRPGLTAMCLFDHSVSRLP